MRVPESKITVPNLPAEYATRPQLLARLDEAGDEQLVVVIAPPGFGKTLLLAEWACLPGAPPTAWVSLDATDNGPRLWSALSAALQAVPGLPPDSPVHRIGYGTAHSRGEDLLDELVEALDDVRPPIRLILDDVHELTAPEPLRALARLVRRRPRGLRLVLSSRVDPPLPLPRLRLEGRLRELRAEQLRFTPHDAGQVLRAAGLEVTPEQVAVLHARTEGWVAGLRLAALALRRRADPGAFIADFSGDERSVADYLTGEVLAGLTEQEQHFLRVCAVCSTLPAGLAVELSGRADAGRVLYELGHETALVERTGPDSYRIHALLRTYLLADLRRHRPALHRRLQTAAARWWVRADDPVHALRHAARAEDPGLMPALLRDTAVGLLAAGEMAAVRDALALVEPATRTADPWLSLVAALLFLEERALPRARRALEQARRTWPPEPGPGLGVLRAAVELFVHGRRGKAGPAPAPASGPVATELDVLVRLAESTAAVSDPQSIDPDGIRAVLEDVVVVARRHGYTYDEVQAQSLLAALAARRGRYLGMVAAAEAAIAAAARAGRHPSRWSALASAQISYGHLLAGDPAAARGRAEEALGAAERPPLEASYHLCVVHGAALGDQGERTRGLTEIQAARSAFGDVVTGSPGLLATLAVLEHGAALRYGNPDAATRTAQWLQSRVGQVGELALMEAWTHLATGRLEAARAGLEPLRAGRAVPLVPHTILEAHLVEAEVALRGGDRDLGCAELDVALELGAAMGVVRPFVLAGPAARQMLPLRPGARGGGWFAERLAVAGPSVHADAAPPLSRRELAVLALLPSLLSGAEIAEELTVSVNTVKSHIRSIYAKLGVSTRREAVLCARERSLIP